MDREYVRHNARRISQSVTKWGRANYREFPWRSTGNIWLALVAEIFLQRTRVTSVDPIWRKFPERYPTPQILSRSDPQELQALMSPLGLKWRVPLVRDLAETLSKTTAIPSSKEKLLRLPGVGPYVSSALRSFHMGIRDTIVDANVVRWICRLTGDESDGETRRAKWLAGLAERLTPKTTHREYNYAVLDLTMTICVRKPKCAICPVAKWCSYQNSRD